MPENSNTKHQDKVKKMINQSQVNMLRKILHDQVTTTSTF